MQIEQKKEHEQQPVGEYNPYSLFVYAVRSQVTNANPVLSNIWDNIYKDRSSNKVPSLVSSGPLAKPTMRFIIELINHEMD